MAPGIRVELSENMLYSPACFTAIVRIPLTTINTIEYNDTKNKQGPNVVILFTSMFLVCMRVFRVNIMSTIASHFSPSPLLFYYANAVH